MALFERVFRGSDEMLGKAEAELDAVIAELGEAAPLTMPSTSPASTLTSARRSPPSVS